MDGLRSISTDKDKHNPKIKVSKNKLIDKKKQNKKQKPFLSDFIQIKLEKTTYFTLYYWYGETLK